MEGGNKTKFLVVGAGFSGAVIARELAERIPGSSVEVWDSRPHVAGNCHSSRDAATGIMLHRYGPHIFNTDSQRVWDYVRNFGSFLPFVNRVKAVTCRGVFSLPINLLTINRFFGKSFSPEEARTYVAGLGYSGIAQPRNFEEQALKTVGKELYEAFFYGYTRKQWGCDPKELPVSVFKRLPVRFDDNDNYYSNRYQGIPVDGYTAVVSSILQHPAITVHLERSYSPGDRGQFDHLFYTGTLDGYFAHRHGRLGYRTVTFERIDAVGDYQSNPVVNYTEVSVPHTRIHEHKHFAPWEKHERTVAFREYSKETGVNDLPYYPKRLEADKKLLEIYTEMGRQEVGVTFLGRLATYRYMDMESVIGEALDYADSWLALSEPWPTFPNGYKNPQ